jgi:hypothetical protein
LKLYESHARRNAHFRRSRAESPPSIFFPLQVIAKNVKNRREFVLEEEIK